jgi:hypothetical protein
MVGKLGKGIIKGSMVVPGGIWKQRENLSLYQVLLKLRLANVKGRTW